MTEELEGDETPLSNPGLGTSEYGEGLISPPAVEPPTTWDNPHPLDFHVVLASIEDNSWNTEELLTREEEPFRDPTLSIGITEQTMGAWGEPEVAIFDTRDLGAMEQSLGNVEQAIADANTFSGVASPLDLDWPIHHVFDQASDMARNPMTFPDHISAVQHVIQNELALVAHR